jgi:hypothetical protein
LLPFQPKWPEGSWKSTGEAQSVYRQWRPPLEWRSF